MATYSARAKQILAALKNVEVQDFPNALALEVVESCILGSYDTNEEKAKEFVSNLLRYALRNLKKARAKNDKELADQGAETTSSADLMEVG